MSRHHAPVEQQPTNLDFIDMAIWSTRSLLEELAKDDSELTWEQRDALVDIQVLSLKLARRQA